MLIFVVVAQYYQMGCYIMKLIQKISTIHTTSSPNRKIEYIVIHYTAGTTSKSGSALNTAIFFSTTDTEVSADYTVDDEYVCQYNGDILNRYTWHCGGSRYSTKGGAYYGKCTNKNSIGIEVCSSNSTGKMQEANDASYSFTAAVIRNTEELVIALMDKYNIPIENVIRHYDVTGKPCPGIIGYNTESGSNKLWNDFKDRVRLKVSSSSSTNTTAESFDNNLYYVQVGAFKSKSNANDYLNKEVKPLYSNAFIKESDGYYYVQVGAFKSEVNANNYLKATRVHFPDAFIKRF